MSDRRAIETIRKTIEQAENAFDADATIALFDDDVVLMVPDYPVQEGKAAATAFTSAMFEFFRSHLNRRIIYTSAEVMLFSDFAVDRGTFRIDVKEIGDKAYERVTGKYLWLLRRRGAAGWKLSRTIISRDDPEEAE